MNKQQTNKSQSDVPARSEDLRKVVVAPVIARLNRVEVLMTKRFDDLAATLEIFARQKAREVDTNGSDHAAADERHVS
jgi:hypothetical protein